LESRSFALKHLYVYPRLGISYTYIPKNACTSFKRTLGEAQGWLDPDASSAHDMKVIWWAQGLVRYPQVGERIVVVRDPFERLLSGFLNRFLMREDAAAQHAMDSGVQDLIGPDKTRQDVTFEDFVQYLARTPDRQLNEHWRPQSNFLIGTYTRFLRFEHLAEDAGFLAERGIPLQHRQGHGTSSMRRDLGPGWGSAPVRRLRRQRRMKEVLPARESMYDEQLADLVAERFAADVELFERLNGA
jgi:hypothetical protein